MSGYTYGSWAAAQKGGSDFVAMSMDADGNILWEYQVGSQEGSKRMYPPYKDPCSYTSEKPEEPKQELDGELFRSRDSQSPLHYLHDTQ